MPYVVFMFNIHCWSWVKGWLSSNLANWCSTMHIKRGGLRSVRKCLSSNCCIFVVKLLYLFSSHILWRRLQRKYNKDNRKNTRTKRKIPAPSWHKIQQVCRRLLEICWGNSAVSDPYLVYTVFKFIPKQVHVWTKWCKGCMRHAIHWNFKPIKNYTLMYFLILTCIVLQNWYATGLAQVLTILTFSRITYVDKKWKNHDDFYKSSSHKLLSQFRQKKPVVKGVNVRKMDDHAILKKERIILLVFYFNRHNGVTLTLLKFVWCTRRVMSVCLSNN